MACTDGVTEARDSHGDFYPLARHIDKALTRTPGLHSNPAQLAAFLEHDLHTWAPGLHDAATLLTVPHPCYSPTRGAADRHRVLS